MSGDIPNHPNLTIEVYASEIARGEDTVKLILRADFPNGAPVDLFRQNAPFGFDISSISRMVFKAKFNCKTLTMTTVSNSGEIYQFNGKKLKSKEPPFAVKEGDIFEKYFCERGEKPTQAPTLKPK